MSVLQDFARASRKRPCPVCSKQDWCLVSHEGGEEPTSAICARVESPDRWGAAGYFHRLRGARRRPRVRCRTIRSAPNGDLGEVQAAHRKALDLVELERDARRLGVSAQSLLLLDAGHSRGAMTFPMRNAAGEVIGIRVRHRSGRKHAIKGSRNGLFIPRNVNMQGRIFIAEGPTDTAALLTIGAAAIGRPDCQGGVAFLKTMIERESPDEVVVVADRDAPGQAGASALARTARLFVARVKVVLPPPGADDIRDWVRAGASAPDLGLLVQAAPQVQLGTRAAR